MQTITIFVTKLFCSRTKRVLLNRTPILFLKYFTLGKKAPCNAISLELHIPFYFQLIIYSVPLPFFDSNTLNVG